MKTYLSYKMVLHAVNTKGGDILENNSEGH